MFCFAQFFVLNIKGENMNPLLILWSWLIMNDLLIALVLIKLTLCLVFMSIRSRIGKEKNICNILRICVQPKYNECNESFINDRNLLNILTRRKDI